MKMSMMSHSDKSYLETSATIGVGWGYGSTDYSCRGEGDADAVGDADHFRRHLCRWRDFSSCDENFMETWNYLEIKQGISGAAGGLIV